MLSVSAWGLDSFICISSCNSNQTETTGKSMRMRPEGMTVGTEQSFSGLAETFLMDGVTMPLPARLIWKTPL